MMTSNPLRQDAASQPVKARVTRDGELLYVNSYKRAEDFDVTVAHPTDFRQKRIKGAPEVALPQFHWPDLARLFHAAIDLVRSPTWRIYIETTVVGPALGAMVKSIVDGLATDRRQRKERKQRKVRVLLYGPDGKEIKWDKD